VANRIYCCTFDNKKRLIVKFYGNELSESFDAVSFKGEAAEAVIVYRIQKVGLGPKVFGFFDGGRIEEFIEGRNVNIEDFKDTSLYSSVAYNLAKYHNLSMPLSRKDNIFKKFKEMEEAQLLSFDLNKIDEKYRALAKPILDFPAKEETELILELASFTNSRVVFSHNDLHFNNMILRNEFDSNNDRIMFLDYDLSSYFYRGFDLAYFLVEHQFRLGANEFGLRIDYFDDQNLDEIEQIFVKEYMNALKTLNLEIDENLDSLEQIYHEIEFFIFLRFLVLIGFMQYVISINKCTSYNSSGVANRIYCCSFSKKKRVIIKFYGSEFLEDVDEITLKYEPEEAIIVYRLHKIGLGPKVFGFFDGGRIEEFVEGRNVNINDFKDISLYSTFAYNLAKYHSLSMPISRKYNLFKNFIEMVEKVNLECDLIKIDAKFREISKPLLEFQVMEEVKWMSEIAPLINSRIVFVHNDLNFNNMILKDKFDSKNDRIMFLDYEWSKYTYRGVDLAYFLVEHQFRVYTNENGTRVDYFKVQNLNEIKETFVQEYIKAMKTHHFEMNDQLDSLNHILEEIEFFTVLRYLFLIAFEQFLVISKRCSS
ncbi:choline/ethanolamine kinase-like protein, partial [Dinothrombium tinctorium]